jgi:hypothetical protein
MKRNVLIRLWVVIRILALVGNASGATSIDDQVKSLVQQYKQAEDQLPRSVHYVRKTESNGVTTIEQAWFNGADDLIKVAVEHSDSSGRELREYFGDFESAYPSRFMLVRKESRLPNGGTQVDEWRKYFGTAEDGLGSGILIRELQESAHFKPGESTDTARVSNVVVDVAKQPVEKRPLSSDLGEPNNVANALKEAGPPAFDPFANVKGEQEKFRVIHDTASPDGRYAIALGSAREKINWDDFRGEETEYYNVEGEDEVRNYVVDLVQQRILGDIHCEYASTFPRHGRNACRVVWSPDSTKFAYYEWSGKWWTHLGAGDIAPGPKLIGVVDLGKQIEKKTLAFVKRRPDSATVSWDVDQVSNDGVVTLNCLVLRRPEGETEFSLSERARLRKTAAGLRAEIVSIRRLPNEE